VGETLVQVLPKQVVLYRRERSTVWQCRYKLADKKWRRTTTGEHELAAATKSALRIYYEGEVKRQNKLPIDSKRFDGIATAVVEQMQCELADGQGKSVYHSYIFAINKYIKPFFGKQDVASINAASLQKFDAWRQQQLGRAPKASTVSVWPTHLEAP
jgi:hypothetical protein